MMPLPGAVAEIYCAGGHIRDGRCHTVTNYGSENYAYLKHIVDHYDDGLAAITVFTMGSVMKQEWDFLLCRKLNYVLSFLDSDAKQRNFSGYATMAEMTPGKWIPFDPSFDLASFRAYSGGESRQLCPASARPLDKWYQKFIGANLTRALLTGIQYNGVFAASRERIRTWPKSVYEGLLKEMEHCGPGVPHVAGHYMERAWKAMLDLDLSRGLVKDEGPDECPIKDMISTSTAIVWSGLARHQRVVRRMDQPVLMQLSMAAPGRSRKEGRCAADREHEGGGGECPSVAP